MSFRGSVTELLAVSRLQCRLTSAVPSSTQRQALLRQIRAISKNVPCPHNESEILTVGLEILSIPKGEEGCIVEAGTYKGGSTSKLSLFCNLAGRKLVAFDSFKGIPKNAEKHTKSTLGHSLKGWFDEGAWHGSLEEVRSNIERYGEIDVCTFVAGWFEDTMPSFRSKVALAYIDVDLASSTRTCLKYLYPLIIPKGILYSQDGDIPLTAEVFGDEKFWKEEVGFEMPNVEGLGKKKLLRMIKDG